MSHSRRSVIPIAEVSNYVKRRINLIGIITEFSFPRKSKGTDFVSILKIVDDSQRYPELSVNIFTESVDQLPHVQSCCDLIVLHNVRIETFENDVFARFNKKFSSFALFNGKVIDDFCCYQSFGNFSLPSCEKCPLNTLRHWLSSAQLNLGWSDYLLTLNNLAIGVFFDLVCEVLHVSFDTSRGLWILYVWDGTDLPPLSLDGKLDNEDPNPFPLQIESIRLDQNTLSHFPSLGSILRVFADQGHQNIGTQMCVGKWVRIRNMTCETTSGIWLGLLTSASRLRLLEENDNVVTECISNFKKRKQANDRTPLWGKPTNLTVIDLPGVIQFVTLLDIINFQQEAVFCSIVRVIAIHPLHLDPLFCTEEDVPNFTMRFTLEDPTARIQAILSGEELVNFFGDFEFTEVQTPLKSLLGIALHKTLEDPGERSPPWIKCCIETTQSDHSEHKQYHICCTKLVN